MAAAETKVDIFMPLYVSDYDRDTAELSFEEHGFYLAILRALWTRGGCLKHAASTASSSEQAGDKQKLARILRTDVETFERIWPSVEKFFVLRADGTFYQKRLSHELTKAKKNKEFAVERARKGGNGKAARAALSSASSTSQAGVQAGPQAVLQVCSSPSGSDLSLSSPRGSLPPDQTPARSNEEANGSDEPRFLDRPLTGGDLQRVFGQVRAKKTGSGLPWQSVRAEGGASSSMAELLNDDPTARADVIPTMELLFDRAKAGKAGNRSADIIREPSFAFGAWLSQWTSLREELHGLTPKIPAAALPKKPGEKPWLEADKARESAAAFARMEGRRVLAELEAAEKAAEQTAAGGAR